MPLLTSLLNSSELTRLNATQLQALLQNKQISSVELILSVLKQIEEQDQKGLQLNAMLALTPRHALLARAAQLDQERHQGIVRGPLHGIPITLKDCIATHPALGLPTSVGSFALLHSKPASNASIVEKLIKAGLIILGKANLTQFCSMKGDQMNEGWSAVGGQTYSPYATITQNTSLKAQKNPDSPGGSSTGSAVSIAAGYTPLAIGSETYGSIIEPASRAGLYALKPTVGQITSTGLWTVSSTCDSLGPMAKSSHDLVELYNIMAKTRLPQFSIFPFQKSFSTLKVGFLDSKLWRWPEYSFSIPGIFEQIQDTFLEAIKIIEQYAAKVVYPVFLPEPESLLLGEKEATKTVFYYEYGPHINHYLKSLDTSPVRTLKELVEWNISHKDLELPEPYSDQERLLTALHRRPSYTQYESAKLHMQNIYRNQGIDHVLKSHNIDILAAPDTSFIHKVATASGYPIATMPLGTLKHNDMPFGLAIMSGAHQEARLFEFMQSFETVFPPRKVPTKLDAKT